MNAFMLDNRMTVVLFAGMGGGCDGLEDAGFHVHLAINHDPVAIAVHEARHRHTRHLRTDVFEVDPREATRGRGVRVLHASPDCTHFSVAKGGKPVSKRRRSLAWVVVRWAGQVGPEVITLENVPEIQTWGPLIAKRDPATGRVLRLDGSVAAKGERVPVREQWLVPDPKHRGRIWKAWLKHMRALGYSFEGRVLVCADYGVHTIRKRYFGVAKKDGSPVVWRERTHAPRKSARKLKLKTWPGMNEKIDWSLPVKSIFGRKKPLADATMRRIARGIMRYVIEAEKPFIVPITHSGGDDRAYPTDEALRTLTCAHRGEFAVVSPHVTKFRSGATGADVQEPSPTWTANSFETRPGGAIPLGLVGVELSAPHLSVMRNSAKPDYAADDPAHAFTAGGANHTLVSCAISPVIVGAGGRAAQTEPRSVEEPACASTTKEDRVLVAATMVGLAHGDSGGRREYSIDEPANAFHAGSGNLALAAIGLRQFGESAGVDIEEPAPAVMPNGQGKTALVAATLVQTGYGEREGQAPRSLDILGPGGTQVGGGGKTALVAAFLAQHNGDPRADGQKAARPGRGIDEPAAALTTSPQIGVAAVFMAQHNDGPKAGVSARAADEPVSALTTTGSQQGMVAASMLSLRGTNVAGRDVLDPVATRTAEGTHDGVVCASLAEMRGRSPDGRNVAEPLAALTGGSNAHLILAFLQHYFSNGKTDDDLAAPLGALTAKARHGLVVVKVRGEDYVITDIGIRMLEPEEGAAAHGFRPGCFPEIITIDGKTRRLTKTEKYHLVGNSVPPFMIRMLAEDNCRRELVTLEAAE